LLKSFYLENCIEAGCDEAGRGCLAGPVVAAAVIFPAGYSNPRLNDSKKLSEKKRYVLRTEVEADALAYAVAFVSNDEIDQLNILKASILAMHKALEKLSVVPEHIIVDGNRFYPFQKIPHTCIVKGDSKYLSIAAASVLAKTYRDDFMCEMVKTYSVYHWEKNKGYPTKDHRQAIRNHGITELHRKTFQLLDEQLSLDFTNL
jgi:ribonuclease HII